MSKSGIILAALTVSLLATGAMAQGMGGAAPAAGGMGMANSKIDNNDPAMKFNREDMIMMIVERDRSTMGMNDEQKKEARAKEAALHGNETPAQRIERKHEYSVGWSKLTQADKDKYSTTYDEQVKARAAAGGGMGGGMGAAPGGMK